MFRGELAPGVWIDFWQADADGIYDNDGYRLRGHQFTDQNGGYRLVTIVPGHYIDRVEGRGKSFDIHRTAHIHVKLKVHSHQSVTTQLYFPDEAQNNTDSIFKRENGRELVMQVTDCDGRLEASFDFALDPFGPRRQA
jgi:protocatechuate 3,4-dioxygenase beta subunit